ncbi:MAG: hypothetical protein GKC10_08975 [Methanosarcinales archaeon]|nr:hypothetical protein [Methanosarcinales archaeon]
MASAAAASGLDLDISPGVCPNSLDLKSQGVLDIAILGSEDLDVKTVDAANATLARGGWEGRLKPLYWNYEDVAAPMVGEGESACPCHQAGQDGFEDLILKFDIYFMIKNLELQAVAGQDILLNLTVPLQAAGGALGEQREGRECLKIVLSEVRP